jgi:hypothetical protein
MTDDPLPPVQVVKIEVDVKQSPFNDVEMLGFLKKLIGERIDTRVNMLIRANMKDPLTLTQTDYSDVKRTRSRK